MMNEQIAKRNAWGTDHAKDGKDGFYACSICGRYPKVRTRNHLCDKHYAEHRIEAGGDGESDWMAWASRHPDLYLHPMGDIQPCPRCDKRPIMDGDYLCEGCRYG